MPGENLTASEQEMRDNLIKYASVQSDQIEIHDDQPSDAVREEGKQGEVGDYPDTNQP